MCHPDDFQAGTCACLRPSLCHTHHRRWLTVKKGNSVQQLPLFKPETASLGVVWEWFLWFVCECAGVPHPQRVLVTSNCELTPLQRAWLLPITDCTQRMADHEQNNLDPDHEEEEEEENEGPRGARRRRGAEVPLDALLRLLAGQRVVVREREAAGGNDELIAGLRRSGMLSRCESDLMQRSPASIPAYARSIQACHGPNSVATSVCHPSAKLPAPTGAKLQQHPTPTFDLRC